MSSPDAPALVVQGGALEGRSLPLRGPQGERVLGSGAFADLRLTAPNVEAQHARLRWNDLGVMIEDLSKEHGTFLNGERVEQATEVGHGDRVSLGPPGDPGSVKLLADLPMPPSEYPAGDFAQAEPLILEEEPLALDPAAAPATGPGADAVAAAESGSWGAVDDDDEVIQAVPGAQAPPPAAARPQAPPPPQPAPPPPPPPPKQATVKVPAVKAPAVKLEPRAPSPSARKSAPPRERPSLSRILMVLGGVLLLGGAAYFVSTRALAGAPALTTLLPPKAEPGQTVQINGSGFASDPAKNTVTFADKPAQVIAANATQLSVVVPQGLAADDKSQHKVQVQVRGSSSNTLMFRVYAAPKVTAFEPDVALPGEVVKAVGENFGDDTTVMVGGKPAEVIEAKPQMLRFKVPDLSVAEGKALPVGVQVGKNSARLANLLIGKLPLTLEIAPARGQPGERATLKGRGFDPAVGATVVTFGERRALVIGASESELALVVPGGTLGGTREVGVSVRAGGSTSSGNLKFTVVHQSASLFLPRFYPEPGADAETVVVASELGPFLRLRGKGDAASVGERAARVAAALNAALEQASRGAVALELREKPDPAVAITGSEQPIVAATAADGLAYDTRPAARSLARFWLAMLQDYVALFAQRERPFRVLELSPKGQALLELYSTAERRSGVGAGVAPSVIEMLPPAQQRALADMALSVSGGQAAAGAGAAVAGRWDGTLEESGRPVRAIQVRIRTGGSGLQGSLTARSGSIAAELPLQDASYRDGTIAFSVTLGASPLRFTGKVEGRTANGQVQTSDGKPAGRFSLRWVE